MTDTHRIKNWLIVDYKTGDMTVRKTKPSPTDLGKNEIMTEVVVDVLVPEPEYESLTATLEVPSPTVQESDIADVEAGEVRTWQEVADDRLDDMGHMFIADGELSYGKWLDHQPDTVIDVLEAAVERPDVDDVREYLVDELERRAAAADEEVPADA